MKPAEHCPHLPAPEPKLHCTYLHAFVDKLSLPATLKVDDPFLVFSVRNAQGRRRRRV